MIINKVSPLKHKYLKITGNIDKPPKELFYLGSLPDVPVTSVAIVGSRKPSAYGQEVTRQIAYDLARAGVIIISGLALGVDAIAHRAALEAGGRTLAVQANGLDKIYPASHKELANQIVVRGGAIISEYPVGTPPQPYQFLARNRLISALADGVLITEAAKRSGSLNTAMHATEQGKEVFAIPGNITSLLSAGTNALIKQGATPVVEAADILNVIAPHLSAPQASLPLGSNEAEATLLRLLAAGLRDGEELLAASGLLASEFNRTLTMLELNSQVIALGANRWTIKK